MIPRWWIESPARRRRASIRAAIAGTPADSAAHRKRKTEPQGTLKCGWCSRRALVTEACTQGTVRDLSTLIGLKRANVGAAFAIAARKLAAPAN